MKCLQAYTTLHKVPNSAQGLHYSDHLAVYALFEIDEKVPRKEFKPLANLEITDEETRNNLNAACTVVDETIQRIQRDQILFAMGFFVFVFILFSFNRNLFSHGYLLTVLTILKDIVCLLGMSLCIWFAGFGKPVERNSLSAARNAMHLRLRVQHFTH